MLWVKRRHLGAKSCYFWSREFFPVLSTAWRWRSVSEVLTLLERVKEDLPWVDAMSLS